MCAMGRCGEHGVQRMVLGGFCDDIFFQHAKTFISSSQLLL